MRIHSAAWRCTPFLILTVLLVAPAALAEIPWRADRPLKWEDFTGPVAARAAPENVAVTAASLGWSYEYALERAGASCIYRITRIEAWAVFDPSASWVKPGHRTASVLAHEQGHFDITQIHKLRFEQDSRRLVGATGTCTGGSTRRASKSVAAEVEQRVQPLYDRAWREHTRAQEAYDRETRHGMDAAAQQRWSQRIAAGLKGRWTAE